MLIDLSDLNCDGCPARHLLDTTRIKQVEDMRHRALQRLPRGTADLILLCESPPAQGFIYDRSSSSSLRGNLRSELAGNGGDDALFDFMDDHGIWVVDCALCPLHRLNMYSHRRHAATICLQRHIAAYLNAMPHAEVKAIFPKNCGFLKKQLPSIAKRITKYFRFSDLKGLKENVDQLRG